MYSVSHTYTLLVQAQVYLPTHLEFYALFFKGILWNTLPSILLSVLEVALSLKKVGIARVLMLEKRFIAYFYKIAACEQSLVEVKQLTLY